MLAEKTAWEFVEQNEVKWDLVTLCPGMVFGALVPGTIRSLKELNTSNGIIWSLFGAEGIPDTKAPSELFRTLGFGWELTRESMDISHSTCSRAYSRAHQCEGIEPASFGCERGV